MRTACRLIISLALTSLALAGEIVVQKAEGDVSVRRGVGEEWTRVAAGDVLRPNDSMRTGKGGTAVVVVRWPSEQSTPKRLTLPPEVMVDLSDIRTLTQDELMMKLTLERVRASSSQWKNDGLHVPNAAVVHGENRGADGVVPANGLQDGEYLFNGAKVLYDNEFYATSLLKAMEVFRLYPALREKTDKRLMLAQAMEKSNLRGEALTEYGSLASGQGLTEAQQQLIRLRMEALRK